MPVNDNGLSLIEQARAGQQARLNTEQGPAYEADLANSLNTSPAWSGFFQALKNKQDVANGLGYNFRTRMAPAPADPLDMRASESPLDTNASPDPISPLNTPYRSPALAGLYSAQAQRSL